MFICLKASDGIIDKYDSLDMLFHINIIETRYFEMSLKRELRWKFYEHELIDLNQGVLSITKKYDTYKIRIDSYKDSDSNGVNHTLTLTACANKLAEYIVCFKVNYDLSISEKDEICVERSGTKDISKMLSQQAEKLKPQMVADMAHGILNSSLTFYQLLDELLTYLNPLKKCASAVATLDVLNNFAERAITLNMTAPTFQNELNHFCSTFSKIPQ